MSKLVSKLSQSIKFIRQNNSRDLYLFNIQNPFYTFLLRILGFKIRSFKGFYSENGQDLIVLNYFASALQEVKNGLYIDVGANHPTKYNNSYFFEKHFDFSTIAVEPIAKFKTLWEQVRVKSKFYNVAISKVKQKIDFTLFEGENNEDMFSGISVHADKIAGKAATISVQALPLSEVVGTPTYDFCILSMDVEGAELEVVQSLDFEKITPSIIIAENNETLWGNEKLRDYIISKGYKYFGRIWSLDDIFIKQ